MKHLRTNHRFTYSYPGILSTQIEPCEKLVLIDGNSKRIKNLSEHAKDIIGSMVQQFPCEDCVHHVHREHHTHHGKCTSLSNLIGHCHKQHDKCFSLSNLRALNEHCSPKHHIQDYWIFQ